MVIIKRQNVKAYILLEGLIAFALLVTISLLVLDQMTIQRQIVQANLKRQEALNVAQMAIQTKQEKLSLNGVDISIENKDKKVVVYNGEEEILRLVQN
ncbi:competence type IV pilus minor pilin ComGE [Streptococcus sp. sy010]|uniref:competence type IV pilus minor pilin ComGE n=1 Tax=Streptococcus sp. sy010 TaxID=2600148 RepID=UPI0011B6A64D|nr:competence type IV pilus minor pilin ComGE [Streptococcus sp. sy010]TWT13388.1 Type II secretory pathway, pseudopilin PulG [Streptococcus sp. sy010]